MPKSYRPAAVLIEGRRLCVADALLSPFSSYCWKVLIPLYEAGTQCTARTIEDPQAAAEWKQRWPIARFPVLVEESSGLTLPEDVLGRVLNDPVIEVRLWTACDLAGVWMSIDSLKELVGRAMDRDDAACRRLTEISRGLRPHLRDPRGRVPTAASTTHELLLCWHNGAYTYNPIDGDMTDGATLATRTAMSAPNFDPRPARRRQRARQRR